MNTNNAALIAAKAVHALLTREGPATHAPLPRRPIARKDAARVACIRARLDALLVPAALAA